MLEYAPPGRKASITGAPSSSVTRMRRPLSMGSMGGCAGTPEMVALNFRRSSPGGVCSFVILRTALLAVVGATLVQGSQAFPRPSPSSSR
jgi:hypothetical protein